ncbi:M1 family aminopeptidase [Streptomyces varsoviensis]|uniref:M1 family aminopeptidase n=1 Tax=Streptomyces varsoviensis TaxID=67373 RepID=UPI0006621A18|nr:M1 family aminopeptidase [Streptomyces varsoviensis]
MKYTRHVILAAAISLCASMACGSAALADDGRGRSANTGEYDALDYDVSLEYKDDTRDMSGSTTMKAKAAEDLKDVSLDFAGGRVGEVTVNGRPAESVTEGEKLKIKTEPLPKDSAFTVRVDFVVTRKNPDDPEHPGKQQHMPWLETDRGFIIEPQSPGTAHRVFPCKDDVTDKATYTFHVTAPSDLAGIANGDLTSTKKAPGGTTTRTYRLSHPVPTMDNQLAVGPYTQVNTHTRQDGVTIRDVVPTDQADRLRPLLTPRTDRQLDWLTAKLGRYPFTTYGTFAALAPAAFESATLATLPLPEPGKDFGGYLMVHEMTHQWFGASLTPKDNFGADLWLAEGHAHLYGQWYASDPENPGSEKALEAAMREEYGIDQGIRDEEGAPAEPGDYSKTGITQRTGGALALYALRQSVGPQTFEKIEQTAANRYQHKVISTQDYINIVREVSGSDSATTVLKNWLYNPKTPPMPGHPNWHPTP